jgi:hypothetical protein
MRLFEKSERYKFRVAGEKCEKWRYNLGYLTNEIAGTGRVEQEVMLNYVRPQIELIASTVIGDRPRFYFRGQEPSDKALGELLNIAQVFDWRVGGMDHEIRMCEMDALSFGTSFWQLIWEPAFKGFRFVRLSPFDVSVTPDTDAMMNCGEAVFRKMRVDFETIAIAFPEAFKYTGDSIRDVNRVKSGGVYGLFEPLPYAYFIEDSYYEDEYIPAGMNATIPREIAYVMDEAARDCEIDVLKVYIREIGRYADLLSDDVLNHITKAWKNRAAMITIAGDRILEIEPSPCPDGGSPIRPFRNALRPDSWYGMDEIEPISTINDALQVLVSRGVKQVQDNTEPPLVHDSEKGTKFPRMMEWMGRKLWPIPGGKNAAGYLETQDISAGLRYLTGFLIQAIKDSTGAHDSAGGRREQGVIAAAAINALRSAYYGRMQPRIDEMRLTLETSGRLLAASMIDRERGYDVDDMEHRVGKTLAAAWGELRKAASGHFDVHIDIGKAFDTDPATLMKFIVEAGQAGAFSDDQRMSVDAKIEFFRSATPVYPGAPQKVRELEERRKQEVTQIAQGAVASMGGQPGQPTQAAPAMAGAGV